MDYGNSQSCPMGSQEQHRFANEAWTKFSRTVRIVLIITLIDDCIVFSDDMQSHVRDLQRVLSKLLSAGFTLCGSKCSFGKTSLSHLGFQYSSEGVIPTADKTHSILNWPTPKSAKELRSFLGLVNFYCRFIPQFADIAAPLTSLTSNKAPFK